MSITNLSELAAALDNWSHRTNVAARSSECIALCEADLQVRAKLVDFEAAGNVTVTAGVGPLPSDFVGARSVYWNGNTATPMEYVAPDRFDALRNSSGGTPKFYTVRGGSLLVNEGATGTAVMSYNAKFTPLSSTAPANSNAILVSYPDAYLWGSLVQLAILNRNPVLEATAERKYEQAIERITTQNKKRKYPGPLVVRAR